MRFPLATAAPARWLRAGREAPVTAAPASRLISTVDTRRCPPASPRRGREHGGYATGGAGRHSRCRRADYGRGRIRLPAGRCWRAEDRGRSGGGGMCCSLSRSRTFSTKYPAACQGCLRCRDAERGRERQAQATHPRPPDRSAPTTSPPRLRCSHRHEPRVDHRRRRARSKTCRCCQVRGRSRILTRVAFDRAKAPR